MQYQPALLLIIKYGLVIIDDKLIQTGGIDSLAFYRPPIYLQSVYFVGQLFEQLRRL